MKYATDSTASWIDYLKTVDAPTLSNAIELLNIRPRHEGFAPYHIRCLFPEFGRLCGWAVTVQVETITQAHPQDPEMLPRMFRAVADSPKPAIVVFQEVGARSELAAHSGEVLASVFLRLGAVGLVTDSCVRDVPEVRALRFHYFARGAVVSHGHYRVVQVGVPVQIMGLTVQPGDLLHGDENGLFHVPKDHLERLPAAVEEVRNKERLLLEFVRGPQFNLDELLKQFFH